MNVTQKRSPLHFSAQNGHERDTELLLANGADVNLVDFEGNSPILACGKNGSTTILQMLLSHGASIHVRASVLLLSFYLVDLPSLGPEPSWI